MKQLKIHLDKSFDKHYLVFVMDHIFLSEEETNYSEDQCDYG
jgi:hypothetical protein